MRRSPFLWLLSGSTLAMLALTKAVYFYFALVFFTAGFLVVAYAFVKHRHVFAYSVVSLILFGSSVFVPIGAWMDRNAAITGNYQLSDSRGGIALNTREVLNHMTVAQYFTSFLYWTRGFGDNLARDFIDKKIWDEFQIDNPKGFYLRAQLGYPQLVHDRMIAENITEKEASKIIDGELVRKIVTNPLTHIAVSVPVIYRGMWVDQFAWLSMPFLFWVVALSLKNRNWFLLALLSPGLFNILFYASFSLNIPRYQMTTAPTFALVLAIGLLMLGERGFYKRLRSLFSRS